ncbi:MAG: hypothetical protein B6D59_06420 [Campylobacteraceae bacterium 4484_4]|nr:MAG: hypothetical protein B6D59_06420 [Campylobacteraceae bacterium 4484_4]
MSKVKIMHLITGLPIGGAEKVLLDLCSHLDKRAFETYVVGLNDERDFFDAFKRAATSVVTLDMQKTPAGFLKAAGEIDHIIERYGIDILHAHMFHPIIFAYLAKIRHRNLKIVFTSHNENIGGRFREIIVKATKKWRDADILFSRQMHTSIYRDDSLVIPNGIDTERFSAPLPKNDRFTFIAVGILREQKNHVALPAMAAKLKEKGYDFVIEIVGSGDASGDTSRQIMSEIEKNSVADCVRMLGARRDIPELLQKAHCFVMPSHFEGLPIALLEAGAAALPVITTPVGAIPSVIDERSGFPAPIEEFSQRMEEVLSDYEEAQKRGVYLQALVRERFSISAMAHDHEMLYTTLLEKF